MKIADLIPSFTAFKSKTDTALEAANKSIADLTAKLEALEAEKQIKADDESDSDSQDSALESLISDLQDVLNKYSKDSSDSDSSDDSSDESDTGDSDDANDETSAKGSSVKKLALLTKKVKQVVAESAKLKDSVASKVIQELAAIGIPTPIATKPDNKPTGLKGRARVAAAFNEQFNNDK